MTGEDQGNYKADLNGLMSKWPDGDASANVRQHYIATVDPELIERAKTWIRPKSPYYTRVDEVVGSTFFVQDFERAIPQSPEIDTFEWRLQTGLGEAAQDFEYLGRFEEAEIIIRAADIRVLSAHGRAHTSLRHLWDFAAKQSDQLDEAIAAWKRFYTSSPQLQRFDLNRLMGYLRRYAEIPGREMHPQKTLLARSKRPKLLREIEEQIQPLQEDKLYDHIWGYGPAKLLDPGLQASNKRYSPEVLMPRSRQAVIDFAQAAAIRTKDENSPPSLIYKKLKALSQVPGFGYGDLTEFANYLTPIMRKVMDVEVDNLDSTNIEDYPRAVDRVVEFILHTSKGVLDERDETRLAEAAEIIKLMAFKGVEKKLGQRVLTLGDIALRYAANLSPHARRELMEQFENARNRRESVVHETYRELRRHHKNRALFRRNEPGQGLLT